MDLSLTAAVVTLQPNKVLPIKHTGGRRITLVSGAIWVTQDRDRRDVVLENGADLVLNKDGGAVLQALGGPAMVALEDGISLPRADDELDSAVLDHLEIDRRARRARAEATAWLFGELRAALRRLWTRVNARLLAAQARHELHALSDHMLKDVGLRRTDIGCLVR